MKRFLISTLIVLCTGTSSLADDVYGCIINETPASYHGTIYSAEQEFNFDIRGDFIWCRKIPEGRYFIRSVDGTLNQNFKASAQKNIGLVGDDSLHWLVKIKEQER